MKSILLPFICLLLYCTCAVTGETYYGCMQESGKYKIKVKSKSDGECQAELTVKVSYDTDSWACLVCFQHPTYLISWDKCIRRDLYQMTSEPEKCYMFFNEPEKKGIKSGKKLKFKFSYKPSVTADAQLSEVPEYVAIMGNSVVVDSQPVGYVDNPDAPLSPEDIAFCTNSPDRDHPLKGSCTRHVECKDGEAIITECSNSKMFNIAENKCKNTHDDLCGQQPLIYICPFHVACPDNYYDELEEFLVCASQK